MANEKDKVKDWLSSFGQEELTNTFFFKGFDNLLVCANLTESDLDSLEVTQPGVRKNILLHSKKLRDSPDYYIQAKADAEKKLKETLNVGSPGRRDIGKKLTRRYLTMARIDVSAYNYLSLQHEAQAWIEESIGEKLGDDFWAAIADGVILCRLVNQIWPGSIPKIHPADSYKYKLLDNITFYLKACTKHGVPENTLFLPLDLFEKKNMLKVVKNLEYLANIANTQGFRVKWRPTTEDDSDVKFTPQQIQAAKKLEGVVDTEEVQTIAKNVSKEEEQKREESQKKKTADQKKATETLRLRREEQEKLFKELKAQEEEEERKKVEEENQRQKEEQELIKAREQKKKEIEDELLRQRQEEERKKKEAEEKAEKEREAKYGGAARLADIRDEINDLREEINVEEGETLLHVVVRAGLVDVARYVIEETNINVNKPNSNQDTALHLAARAGKDELVELLLKSGANVNILNRDGDYPLHNAAAAGHTQVVDRLIKAGAEIDARNLKLETPLLLAVGNLRTAVTDTLIKNGADVNAFSKDEVTCLHLAAEKGSVELINKLFNSYSYKLDLNPRNRENSTPLQLAAENLHIEAVKRLVELGADLHTKRNDGWDPLYTAAYNGDTKTAVFLLSKGADVNGVDGEGWTSLHAAASQGHLDIIKSFIEDFHAKINVMNERGTTPLFHAVSAGNRKIAAYLLDKGADVNLSGEKAWKPIHAATYNEFRKLTELLVERSANLSAQCKDIKNYSPLHILISTEDPPVKLVQTLIKHHAPIDIQHESGGTPLHLAAFWGHLEVTKALVEAGAKLDIKNDKHRTALEVAALYGNKEVAEYLAQKSGVATPKMKDKHKKTSTMKAPVEPPAPEKKP